MNFRNGADEESTFQITPLIDVVFLLLFFFMSLSTLFQMEKEMDVSVPEAENVDESNSAVRQIIINLKVPKDPSGSVLDHKSEIWVNQSRLTAAQLSDKLQMLSNLTAPKRVLIRADGDSLHEDVVEIMSICRGAGIEDMAFAAVEKEES